MHFKQTRLVIVLGVSYIFSLASGGAVIMDYMANSEKQIFDRVYQTPLRKSCNIILVFFSVCLKIVLWSVVKHPLQITFEILRCI